MIYSLIHLTNTILLLCNLLAFRRINRLLRLPRIHPIREFREESSEEVSVRFLGFFGMATLYSVFMLLYILTRSQVFIRLGAVMALLHLIGILAEIFPQLQQLLRSADRIEKVPEVILGQLALSQLVHLLLMYIFRPRRALCTEV